MLSFLTALAGCSRSSATSQVGPFATQGIENKDSFYAKNDKLIADHQAELVNAGRMSPKYGMAYIYLGTYGWFGDDRGGYFGAYQFSETAYEQAKRAWFGNFRVLKGSRELLTGDDNIRFDDSAIGLSTPSMNMTWFSGDKMESEWFVAKIVGVKDNGKTLVLDQRAPHHAEQWNTLIVPADWRDLCNCTNNFHPPLTRQQ